MKYPWRIAVRLIVIASCFAAAYGFGRVYYHSTSTFDANAIQYDVQPVFQPKWEIEAIGDEQKKFVIDILDQPFKWLGKGGQSFAFQSNDGKYVLKFFKFKHLKPWWLITLLPDFPPFSYLRQMENENRQKRLGALFDGYKLAYDYVKEESGLVFIHLNQSGWIRKHVELIDNNKKKYLVNIDEIPFVIQEKGIETREVITNLLENNDIDAAFIKFDSIFSLFISEYSKGLYDRDHGAMHNTGFIGERPFHLDTGKLSIDRTRLSVIEYKSDLTRIALKMELWLRIIHPEHHPVLSARIERRLGDIFNEPFSFKGKTYDLATFKGHF